MSAPDRLRALVAEATPGPWSASRERDHTPLWEIAPKIPRPADVTLIALAPQLAELCADMGETVRLMLAPMGKQFHAGYEADLRIHLSRLDALFPEREA